MPQCLIAAAQRSRRAFQLETPAPVGFRDGRLSPVRGATVGHWETVLENRIKEQQLDLFAERTWTALWLPGSTATNCACARSAR